MEIYKNEVDRSTHKLHETKRTYFDRIRRAQLSKELNKLTSNSGTMNQSGTGGGAATGTGGGVGEMGVNGGDFSGLPATG